MTPGPARDGPRRQVRLEEVEAELATVFGLPVGVGRFELLRPKRQKPAFSVVLAASSLGRVALGVYTRLVAHPRHDGAVLRATKLGTVGLSPLPKNTG